MNIEQFDDLLKNKLASISSPLGDDTWSKFEKILDANAELHHDIGDDSFDKTIKEKILTNRNVGGDTQWQLLKEKLNNIKHRRDSIFLSKAMELVAVFLIIFTLSNINGYFLPQEDEAEQINPSNFASALENKKQNTFEIENSPSSPVFSESSVGNETFGKALPKRTKKQDILKTTLTAYLSNQDVQPNTQSNGLPIESALVLLDIASKNVVDNESYGVLDQDGINISSVILPIEKLGILTSNEKIDIAPIPVEIDPIYTEMASIFPMQISANKGKTIKAISAFVSADINLINSPFDKLYSIPSYTKEALNNSYGLRISTKNDNLEIESGLDYSRREYQPALFKEAFGNASDIYFETSLDKITFDIASIPLNLKYHFINKPAWSSYIMVGVALNLIVNADYEIPTVLVEGRPSPDRYTPVRPRLEEREFTQGLLNGYALKDNYFATAGFGIGIEKKIFQNTSVYIQPSYHRHLLTPGIGPKNDKIHTSSLQFGVKTILN